MQWLASLAMFGAVCMAQPGPPDTEQALDDLLRTRSGGEAVQRDLATLEGHLATDVGRLWPKVDHVLRSPQVPIDIRIRILRLLVVAPDSAVANRLVGMAAEWGRALATDRRAAADDGQMLAVVLDGATRPPLADAWATSSDAVALYVQVTVNLPSMRDRALALFKTSRVPAESKQEAALAMILQRPNITEVEPALLQHLDNNSLATLRDALHKSSEGTVHMGAAAALAHLGDERALPDLESVQTRLKVSDPSIAGYFQLYTWQVQMQHPPERLVDYIAKATGDDARWPWALRRAVELGISKDRLRDGILAYVDALPTKQVRNPSSKQMASVRPGAIVAKAEGLRLQVLLPTDLPDVIVPKPPHE